MPEYKIICRENSAHSAEGINIPAFNTRSGTLDEAVRRVEQFCAQQGLQIRELPDAIGKGDYIYLDCSGELQAIVRAWHCEPSERIHICEVGTEPEKGFWLG